MLASETFAQQRVLSVDVKGSLFEEAQMHRRILDSSLEEEVGRESGNEQLVAQEGSFKKTILQEGKSSTQGQAVGDQAKSVSKQQTTYNKPTNTTEPAVGSETADKKQTPETPQLDENGEPIVTTEDGEVPVEEDVAEELSEEELAELQAAQADAAEDEKINQEFDAYVEADAEAESRKIHEQVIGKKVKRAVSISLDES